MSREQRHKHILKLERENEAQRMQNEIDRMRYEDMERRLNMGISIVTTFFAPPIMLAFNPNIGTNRKEK